MSNTDKDFITGALRPTHRDGSLVHITPIVDVSSHIGQGVARQASLGRNPIAMMLEAYPGRSAPAEPAGKRYGERHLTTGRRISAWAGF
jgi:hypothetical protein